MSIGWQEIITLGIVALAALIVVRRLRALYTRPDACCGGSCSAPDPLADRAPLIKELHEIQIDPPLPPNDQSSA